MFQKLAVVIGRAFLSLIFLLSAIHKIIDWHGVEDMLDKALTQSLSTYQSISWLSDLMSSLQSWGSLLLVIALILELAGGLMVFFGVKQRLGAVLLLLFLIPTTLFFHAFWSFEGAERQTQLINFLQNTSICGGLLILIGLAGRCKKLNKIEADERG